jgi:two-component system phosphate regulon response regulator PhoB
MARILVVEDDASIRELIEFKLRRLGHEVHSEVDGEAGLAAAGELRPDLVLLDWMMPRLSGLEVCLELRASEELARVPVILLTAKAQEADVQRGFAAGADDYIVKPFSPRELVSRVDAAIARGAMSR